MAASKHRTRSVPLTPEPPPEPETAVEPIPELEIPGTPQVESPPPVAAEPVPLPPGYLPGKPVRRQTA